MLIWVVQHNRGFIKHEFCDLLGLACPNHNVNIIIPILIENRILMQITTTDAIEIYALMPSVAVIINYDISSDGYPVLVAQFTAGQIQIKNKQIKRAVAKAAKKRQKRRKQRQQQRKTRTKKARKTKLTKRRRCLTSTSNLRNKRVTVMS